MIKKEIIGDLVRTYSDKRMKIHGGFPVGDYDEAFDPVEIERAYTETDIPIEEEITVEDKAQAYDILMGESND